MDGVLWQGKSGRANKWTAYYRGRQFTMFWSEDVMSGKRVWKLVLGTFDVVEIHHAGRLEIRAAQIAAEDKIEEYMRKVPAR